MTCSWADPAAMIVHAGCVIPVILQALMNMEGWDGGYKGNDINVIIFEILIQLGTSCRGHANGWAFSSLLRGLCITTGAAIVLLKR